MTTFTADPSKPLIICDGDSWVFGCEIVDPELASTYSANTHPGVYDYLSANDKFRIPRIFSTHLSHLLNSEVINLSWPADGNGSIIQRTINFIIKHYISKGIPTDNLFVIIGWSSPERNLLWYKDDKISMPFRLSPQVPNHNIGEQAEIWKLYVTYLWNTEEYIPRFVRDVSYLQNFCNTYKIKWMCFNSFYQSPKSGVESWKDLDLSTLLSDLNGKLSSYQYHSTNNPLSRHTDHIDYKPLWDTIDCVRFYNKDRPNNTFKSYIESIEELDKKRFNGWHPSPESHKVWAEELVRYILHNNLI
jgi:hypothetical protein